MAGETEHAAAGGAGGSLCPCGRPAVQHGYCADCAQRLRGELIGALHESERRRIQRWEQGARFRFSDQVLGQVVVDGAPRVVYVAAVCPACGEPCARPKVLYSRLGTPVRHTDLYLEYPVLDATRYEVAVCCNCGFAALDGDFAAQGAVLSGAARRDWGPAPGYDGERTDMQAIMAYRLALYFATHGSRPRPAVVGRLQLRTAWLHRRAGRAGAEQAALSSALAALETSYSQDRLPDASTAAQLEYLIGELYLRLGQPAPAARWFHRIISARPHEQVKPVLRMARERLPLAVQAHSGALDPARIPWTFT